MTQTDPAADAEPSRREALEQRVETAIEHVKPHLRGWLHAGMTPVALVAGIVLVVLAGTTKEKVSAAVFAGTAVLLFGTSAVYHRGTWSPRVGGFLRRFDHSNIFLLIAGSYTPFALIFLEGSARTLLLAIVWTGAILGVVFRVFWTDAPRWLYVPIYIALGWAAVFFIPQFAAGARAFDPAVAIAVLALVAAGGILYTLGGVVYGLKRPNPFPRWFGFHEVFHTFTVLAFATHYVGVSLATYSLR